MAKKTKNPTGPDQTRSETTAAAQTLFNEPNQPQSPVTTDNLSKTIEKAVQEAFAKKEKKDMTKLKVQMKNPPATVPGVERKIKGRFKTDQVPYNQAPEKPQKIRGKFKVDQVPFNEVEQKKIRGRFKTDQVPYNLSPGQPKPKVKIKLPTPYNVVLPDGPRKPKVKMKGQTPYNVAGETQTPTGMAINQITDSQETKPKVKFTGKVPFNTVESTQTDKAQAVTPNANKTSKVLERKAEKVTSFSDDPDIIALKERLDKADMERKAEKVAAPSMNGDENTPKSRHDKRQSRKEAAEALKSLGFKKAEFEKLLDQVDHIEKTEDKILYVLKLKANPAAKIPKKEVPAAVTEAQKDAHETIHPAPVDPNVHHPKEPSEPAAVPVVTPTPVVPVKPASPNKEEDDADQAQARKDKEEAAALAARIAQKKREEAIEKTLKDIMKKIGNKGVFDNISDMISKLLAGLVPSLLGPLLSNIPKMLGMLGKASLVIGTGVLAYEGAKYLLEKAGYTGETLGKAFSSQDHEVDSMNASYKLRTETSNENRARTQNAALKGTGFTSLGNGAFKNGDVIVKQSDLPPEIRSRIVSATSKADSVKNVAAKLEPVIDNAVSMSSAERMTPVDQSQPQQESEPSQPVVVHQDNRKTIVQSGDKGDSNVLIKVRNDEPSASGLIASMFEHPVSYGGVYRM